VEELLDVKDSLPDASPRSPALPLLDQESNGVVPANTALEK
jgi:hypothetical protein